MNLMFRCGQSTTWSCHHERLNSPYVPSGVARCFLWWQSRWRNKSHKLCYHYNFFSPCFLDFLYLLLFVWQVWDGRIPESFTNPWVHFFLHTFKPPHVLYWKWNNIKSSFKNLDIIQSSLDWYEINIFLWIPVALVSPSPCVK